MKLYGAIDLHSNNSYIVILDEQDKIIFQQRLDNDLAVILSHLSPYQSQLQGIAVESTFNWYWLVDGMMEAGYRVHLVNTAAVHQYAGLKFTDDASDARWLAHLLRLGILPEGYICPKKERAIRDMLRKRSQLVRYRTANILSIQNLISRNVGQNLKGKEIKTLEAEEIGTMIPEEDRALAINSNVNVMHCLEENIQRLENAVKKKIRLRPSFRPLLTVNGIGFILGMTIMLETGEISRFPRVGDYASYCRCVQSRRFSNGKKKGEGNRKNGNKYLAWAFVEAAHFAVRYNNQIKRFYQRKAAKKNKIVAIKAVAHKLARACYHVLKDQVSFDVERAFS